MLSESVVRREEPPSFLLFPPEGHSRHFFPKRKGKKRRSIEIRLHGGRRFPPAEERKRKKKKAKERNPPVCRVGLFFPPLEKKQREKAGLRSSERFFPLAKRGTPPDAESGREDSFLRCSSASRHCQKKEKEKTSFELRAEEKEEKRSTVLSLPSLLFRMFSLLHSSKRRETASHRYAGRSKRC